MLNPYESMIQNNLENTQDSPGEGLRNRILESAAAGIAAPPARRRIGAKTLAFAAVISVFALGTVLAYASGLIGPVVVKKYSDVPSYTSSPRHLSLYEAEPEDAVLRITFGDSTAYQFELDEPRDTPYEFSYGIKNFMQRPAPYEYVRFYTIDEARQAAPFSFKTPAYLPENVTLDYVFTGRYADGTYDYDLEIIYKTEIPDDKFLSLFITYGGSGSYLEIKTTNPIQKVMIGDTEAIFLQGDEGYARLVWMMDDSLYEISAQNCDLETLITVAESIQ